MRLESTAPDATVMEDTRVPSRGPELVARYSAAKSRQDVEGALALCHEDFVLDAVPFGIRGAGDRRGRFVGRFLDFWKPPERLPELVRPEIRLTAPGIARPASRDARRHRVRDPRRRRVPGARQQGDRARHPWAHS